MSECTKRIIDVDGKEPVYFLDEGVTFSQVDGWFGHITHDLKMDLITPRHSEKKYPCIIWICGGGWQSMDRGAHFAYLAELARKGFVVSSIEYRLAGEANFPAALIDVKSAIRYLKANAEKYRIDVNNFGIMGESAGGYLTAMAALTPNIPEFEVGDNLEFSTEVQAACPWYMPTDLGDIPGDDKLMEISFLGSNPCKDQKLRNYSNPLTYVTKQAPPFLILHGTNDGLIPFHMGEDMYSALEKNGVEAHFVGLKGEDHAGPKFFQQEVWEIITQFFKEKLY